MKKLIAIASFLALALCAAIAYAVAAPTTRATIDTKPAATVDSAVVWADSIASRLTLRQQIAQLMMPRLDVVDNAAGYAKVKTMAEDVEIGGFLLGKGTLKDYVKIINYAQEHSRVPMLVSLDGEWGLAMRVSDAPRFPYNMTLGAITDPQLLYEYGREVGRECRAVGINIDFAPVLDVNSNPLNPVIGYRSFGENPRRVAQLGVEFSEGMESMGVMSVAKHFPGHGDTSTDSHKTLPVVNRSAEQIDTTDLVPFKRYIDHHLSGVMVGHLNIPALDPSGAPTSLSRRVTTELLHDRMGFNGLVFTDALNMKGALVGNTNNCVSALLAGADVLLGSGSVEADIKAIEKAVETGTVSKSLIGERCRKVLRYKYLLGLNDFHPADAKNIKSVVDAEASAVIGRLSNAAITLTANREGLLPLTNLEARRVGVMPIGGSAKAFIEMADRYSKVESVSPSATDLDDYDVVLAPILDNSESSRAIVARMARHKNFVAIFFLNPYKIAKFGDLDKLATVIVAYENLPSLQRAAAQAVFGGIDVAGRLPVSVKGLGQDGSGIDLKRTRLGFCTPAEVGLSGKLPWRIDKIVDESLKKKAFPGCQVLVAKNGMVVFDKSFGYLDYADGSPKVTDETLYDIASMSKIVGTMSGLMRAYDDGLFQLEDTIGKFVEGVRGTDKGDITMRQLLFHESGMPAAISVQKLMVDTATFTPPLYSRKPTETHPIFVEQNLYGNKDARLRSDILSDHETEDFDQPVAEGIYAGIDAYATVMQKIYDVPTKPRGKYVYSDLNFCLLMEAEEAMTGVAHDEWVATEVFHPIGAWHTGYLPLTFYDKAKIAPTEVDNFLRRQHLQGYVHDEIAAFSGGVQGNAGVFANAFDIAKLAQTWLGNGSYGGVQIFKPETVKLFTTTHSKNQRTLGFDLLSRNRLMNHPKASANAYGHTGFTGTCLWVDPAQGLIIVILTNRVNPSRVNPAFSNLNPRGAIVRAVYDSL